MATYLGKDGLVQTSADNVTYNNVGELRGFSIEHNAETIEDTVMGEAARTYKVTYKNFTATLDMLYDMDDTAQDQLAVGTTVYFKFFPEDQNSYGTPDSGDEVISGQGVILNKTINANFDGLVEASVSVQGTGALTFNTV